MFKLTIENFQSIKDKTSIEFIPGVNLIIGPSNSGKTAILRSLIGLILNYKGKVRKYLTHFQDKIQVDLQLKEDEIYTWVKSEKGTEYIINKHGEEEIYKKSGNNNIFDFIPDFPFILRDKKLVNTHTEHDGLPFPFNMNDIELFKMFEDLYNVSSTATIFKFLKKLETQTNSEINTIERDIEINKHRIEAIIELEDHYNLEDLEQKKEIASKLLTNFKDLEEDLIKAKSNNSICKKIKNILEDRPDDEHDLKIDLDIINEFFKLKEDYIIANNNNKFDNIKLYNKDFEISIIDSYNNLLSDIKILNNLENEVTYLDKEEIDLKSEYEQIKSQLDKIDICPLCGNNLKGE